MRNKHSKIITALLISFIMIALMGAIVLADYGGWVELTGSDIYHGQIRSGWLYDSSINLREASTQAEVYNSSNNAVYHYSRVKVINIITSTIYGDSGRIWGTYRTTASEGWYNNDFLYGMRPYWGTN